MSNQAIGLIPMLLFMVLDNYFSYIFAYLVGFAFCVISIIIYQLLSKDKIYQFMLWPTSVALSLYSLFLFLRLEPVLFDYSPLIIEVLLVVVLAMVGFTKGVVLKKIRDSNYPAYKRTLLRTSLNEYYFVVQLTQGIYTLYLFAVLFYTTFPDTMQDARLEHFLYRELNIIIGVLIIIYEQIRLTMMHGSLKKEMWLPVLSEEGKVIGCIARSVSRSLPKKYYHPIIRVAVVYDGKLYLTKRGRFAYTSADTYDLPFERYVLFRHTLENTVKEALGELAQHEEFNPRFLVRYLYEDQKVKHQVSLYVITLQTEEQFNFLKKRSGKLWTQKQIEENLNSSHVFSGYFEKEFPYLQKTILFAESFTANQPEEEPGLIS